VSKFNLIGDATIKPEGDFELNEGGVWCEVIYLDSSGDITTKELSYARVLIPRPGDEYRWDFRKAEWAVPQIKKAINQ
jgi:hypothetical protein